MAGAPAINIPLQPSTDGLTVDATQSTLYRSRPSLSTGDEVPHLQPVALAWTPLVFHHPLQRVGIFRTG